MFKTVTAPLVGWRSAPLVETIFVRGADLREADFLLQVRDRRDGGYLRASLGTVTTAAAEGVRVADFDRINGVDVTAIVIRINETTMESMPLAPEPGADVDLAWGMHITPVGELKFMAFDGPFTVKASAPE